MKTYDNGKIYKLINDINADIYVGSTCSPLYKRLGEHKSMAISRRRQSHLYNTMLDIGVQHFRIILVENYPCASKDMLTAREQHWIDNLKPKLNKSVATTGLNLKDPIGKQQYYLQYYAENKNNINFRVNCNCGGRYTLPNKSCHNKSKRHMFGMERYKFDTEVNRLGCIVFD